MTSLRQGIWLTKNKGEILTATKKCWFKLNAHIINKTEDPEDLLPQKLCREAYVCIKPMHKIFSDQTGKFPYTSTASHQYIMIQYLVDVNIILAESTTWKLAKELGCVYQKLHNQITKLGHPIKIHVLDNKAPKTYKTKIRNNKSTYQLVPPHKHQKNRTE